MDEQFRKDAYRSLVTLPRIVIAVLFVVIIILVALLVR